MIIHADTVAGTTCTETQTGWTAVRSFIVEGFDGSTNSEAAAADVLLKVSGLPKIGDSHDGPPGSDCICISRQATPIGPATWRVECQYSSDLQYQDGWRYSVSGTTIERESLQTPYGTDVPKLEPTGTLANGKTYSVMDAVQPTMTFLRPSIILTVSRRCKLTTFDPFTVARSVVGRVNENSFDITDANLNDKQTNSYNWLCIRCSGEMVTKDVVDATLEFQYDDQQWDMTAYFIDPDTGRPVAGGTEANGCVVTISGDDVYEAFDFSTIGIGSMT